MNERPQRCVLCNHHDSELQPSRFGHVLTYSCPRCGLYHLAELLNLHFRRDWVEHFELACVAAEFHLKHKNGDVPGFVLTDEGKLNFSPEAAFPNFRIFRIDEMYDLFPRGSDHLRRGLLNLSRMVRHPTDTIPWDLGRLPYALFTMPNYLEITTYELDNAELIREYSHSGQKTGIRIRAKGWDRISEWEKPDPPHSRQAFVAMWFNPDMDTFYRNGFDLAIRSAGFDPKRIDMQEHNNKICDEIVAEIRRSRFLVSDFTGQRGGVYFEAGFAMGLGIPVIWTVRKDQIDQVHFDTRQYNHIVYETPEELRQKLYNRIAATIQ